MSVYVETSAVLAWLFEEAVARNVVAALDRADHVFSSELTLVECDRALVRVAHLGELPEAEAGRRRAAVAEASWSWTLMGVTEEVMTRARKSFPLEPVRTLDALHLASALLARSAATELELLALDDRVRRNGRALGFALTPERIDP